MSAEKDNKLAIFEGKRIRKTLHEGEWWFVVEDVVLALIESRDPKQYIQRMKQRDPELGKGWVQIVHTLSILTEGGPQPMLCAKTERKTQRTAARWSAGRARISSARQANR